MVNVFRSLSRFPALFCFVSSCQRLESNGLLPASQFVFAQINCKMNDILIIESDSSGGKNGEISQETKKNHSGRNDSFESVPPTIGFDEGEEGQPLPCN